MVLPLQEQFSNEIQDILNADGEGKKALIEDLIQFVYEQGRKEQKLFTSREETKRPEHQNSFSFVPSKKFCLVDDLKHGDVIALRPTQSQKNMVDREKYKLSSEERESSTRLLLPTNGDGNWRAISRGSSVKRIDNGEFIIYGNACLF
jgi:hypothetical protein